MEARVSLKGPDATWDEVRLSHPILAQMIVGARKEHHRGDILKVA